MPQPPFTDLLQYLRKVCGTHAARDLTDGELLERFRHQRDEAAFSVLVHRHGPMVLGVCRRVLGDCHDAEDAFQAAFLVLVRRAAAIARTGSLPAWLHGVAQRVSTRARSQRIARQDREKRVKPIASAEPVDDLNWQEVHAVLDQEIARLAEKHRAPLVLCYLQGKSYAEASRVLGWSKSAVSRRLGEARELLRERLVRRGIALSSGALATILCERLAGPVVGAMLTINTIKAACNTAAAKAVATTYISAQAAAWADGVVTGVVGLKAKVVLIALGIGVAVCGVGVAKYGRLSENQQAVTAAESTKQSGPAGIGQQQKKDATKDSKEVPPPAEQPRLDFDGEPLPPGALFRLGTRRFRSGSNLQWLGFLPKSNTLVTAGEKLQLWDVATGKIFRHAAMDQFLSRTAFAMSGDGKLLAQGGFQGRPNNNIRPPAVVAIWNVDLAKQVRSLEAPEADVDYSTIALTPDGKLLISLSRTGLMLIQDAVNGAERKRHKFSVDIMQPALRVSADGSMIAVGTGPNSRKVLVWNWQTAEEPRDFIAPGRHGDCLAFSPDSRLLAECGRLDDVIRVWDVSAGELKQKLAPTGRMGVISSLAYSKDGKTLFCASINGAAGAVDLWDVGTAKHFRRFDRGVENLADSMDGRYLAGINGSTVYVWDIESGKLVGGTGETHEGITHQIIAARDTIATSAYDGTVRLWDASNGKQHLMLSQPGPEIRIALSPDAKKLLTAQSESLSLWDTATAAQVYRLPGYGPRQQTWNASITADGRYLLLLSSDYRFRKIDMATGKALMEYNLEPRGLSIARDTQDPGDITVLRKMSMGLGKGIFSADGATFVLDTKARFHVFELGTGKEKHQFSAEGGLNTTLAMSPDGRMVLANPSLGGGSNGRTVTLWEVATGQARKSAVMPAGGNARAAFSSDGKLFAASSGAPNCQVLVWDAITGNEELDLKGFTGRVCCLAFAGGSDLLVTGMDDCTLLVWDLKKLARKGG